MDIREARAEDAKQIQSIVVSLSHFYLENSSDELPTWFSNTLQESEFKRRLSSDDFTNFVYVSNNIIVGYISVKNRKHLYHLFVSENHQGKGISKQLWQYANSMLGNSIDTVRSSIFAIPIYKKFGFKESSSPQVKDGIGFQPMELTK